MAPSSLLDTARTVIMEALIKTLHEDDGYAITSILTGSVSINIDQDDEPQKG